LFLGAFHDARGELLLFMEHVRGCSFGVVLDQMKPKGQYICAGKLVKYAQQIADGMDYLHRSGIIHRDLKPGNILIDKSTDIVKISDFTFAKILDNAAVAMTKSDSYSSLSSLAPYVAPELESGLQYTPKVDVYSFGVVLYEMATGKVPEKMTKQGSSGVSAPAGSFSLAGLSVSETSASSSSSSSSSSSIPPWLRLTFPEHVPSQVQELIQQCMSLDADKRPAFADIVTKFTEIEEALNPTRPAIASTST